MILKPPFHHRSVLLGLAPGLLLAAGLLWRLFPEGWGSLAVGVPSDPDGMMHLVRLRLILAGHWNGLIDRDNAPFGYFMHWTWPFDVEVLSFYLPLRAILGDHSGDLLSYVAGSIGMVNLLVACCLAGWCARAFGGRDGLTAAAILAGGAMGLLAYASPGRAGHHILGVDFCLAALGASSYLVRRPSWRLSTLAGVFGAFALWSSMEALPFAIAGLAVPWVWSLHRSAATDCWRSFAVAAIASGLAVAIDPPPGSAHLFDLDRVSVAHVVLLLALAVSTWILRRGPAWRRSLALPIGVAAWISMFPAVLSGAAGLMPGELIHLWWDEIVELSPTNTLQSFATWALGMFLAGVVCGTVAVLRARRIDRSAWGILAAACLAAGGMACLHIRFSCYGSAMVAVACGSAVGRLASGKWSKDVPLRTALLALAPIAIASLLPAGMTEAGPQAQDEGGIALRSGPHAAPFEPTGCSVSDIAEELDGLTSGVPSPVVMTEVNVAPAVLFFTGRPSVVAGPYQRNIQGLGDAYRFWRSLDDRDAMRVAKDRHVGFVLVCRSSRVHSYERDDGIDLYDRLVTGKPPSWLEAVNWPRGVDTDFALYRVRSGEDEADFVGK